MTVLDVNLLLYAYNADAPQHETARNWLNELLRGSETIGLPWMTIWAFVRLTTNPRVFVHPLAPRKALSVMDEWLRQPRVVALLPGPRHWEILQALVLDCQAAGELVSDAVLAALALEHGGSLASTDHDFSRFPTLRWVNPVRGQQ